MAALRPLVFAALLMYRRSVLSVGETEGPSLETSGAVGEKCWIFTHLSKSGGWTIKSVLKKHFHSRFAIYDEPEWSKGAAYIQSFAQRLVSGDEWDVVAGGCTEAVRRSTAANEKCQWFTMFRHPILRMVSAYYYCKTRPSDTLCATSVLNAKNIDHETLAKHWGNFGMRQFAYRFAPVDDVLTYAQNDAMKEELPPTIVDMERVPTWYALKTYLDSQVLVSEHQQTPDFAMYDTLEPVRDFLRDKYTVGVLEEFNTTLTLFEVTLNMPGLDWHEAFAPRGKQNVDNKYKHNIEKSLAEAWTNSEIKEYMQLDLVLYEHAVDVFREQARAYGIN